MWKIVQFSAIQSFFVVQIQVHILLNMSVKLQKGSVYERFQYLSNNKNIFFTIFMYSEINRKEDKTCQTISHQKKKCLCFNIVFFQHQWNRAKLLSLLSLPFTSYLTSCGRTYKLSKWENFRKILKITVYIASFEESAPKKLFAKMQ